MKPFKYNDNSIGAKVLIPKVLKSITPENGWEYLKNISGVIVENKGYEQYYHTSSGSGAYPRKSIIQKDPYPTYAVQLENQVTDIEGNNIIIVREWDIKFCNKKEIKKPITLKEYRKALKLIEEYEGYEDLKNIGKY